MIKKFRDWFCYVAVFSKLFFMIAVYLIFVAVSKSDAAVITVEKNKSLSLCKELKQILDEPVNEQGKGYNFRISQEFNIPKKYKNFSLLKWEDVDVKDIRKYVLSEKKLDEIEEFNEKFKGKAKMLIQKARVDINHDGVNETFIRFKSSDINIYDNYKHRKWNYYVSDIGSNSGDISKTYSTKYGYIDGVFPFHYKGRFYQLSRYVPSEIVVYEPRVVDPEWISCRHFGKKCNIEYKDSSSLGMILICNIGIKLTRQELTNMGYSSEYVDKHLKVYYGN